MMNGKAKRHAMCAAVLLALLALGALALALRLHGAKTLTAQQEPIAAQDGRDFMQASLTYDPGTRTLRGTQTLTATNRGGEARTEAVLRLYMNGEAGASVSVSGVTVDGRSVSCSQEEDDPTVLRIPFDWAAGQTVEVGFTVMIKHAQTDAAALITLPALAVFEDGAWRTDAFDELADPSYAEAFDCTISLVSPDEAKAAFGGALIKSRWETGVGETLYTAQMQGARDIAFALCKGGAVRQRQVDGVLVTAIAGGSETASALLARAQEALESLDKAGFAYPFASLTVAQADAGREDGLALSGLCALSAEGDRETLLRRMTRLVARQTFGVLVENDPWQAPWLSQTLASTAELLAYRARKGEDAFYTRYYEQIEVATRLTRPHGVTVGAGTDHFGGDAEMTQVLRDQGAAMMIGIEQAVGEEAFLDALQAYVRENAGGIADRAALEAALDAATGSRWDGYLEDELTW